MFEHKCPKVVVVKQLERQGVVQVAICVGQQKFNFLASNIVWVELGFTYDDIMQVVFKYAI